MYVPLKTRSPGNILEKPCYHCRVHIYYSSFISDHKTWSPGQTLEKTFTFEITYKTQSWWNLPEKCFSWQYLRLIRIMVMCLQNAIPSQISEKPCYHCIDHIYYYTILMKLCLNSYLDNTSNEFEIRSCWVKK